MRRYESTRRRHPLAGDERASAEAIDRERAAARAGEGRGRRRGRHQRPQRPPAAGPHPRTCSAPTTRRAGMQTTVVSFGYKHGLPARRRPRDRLPLPAQPALGRGAAAATGLDDAGARLRARPAGDRRVPRPARRPARPAAAGLRGRGQELPHRRLRLHRRPAPLGGHRRGDRRRSCGEHGRRPDRDATATVDRSRVGGAGHGAAIRSDRTADPSHDARRHHQHDHPRRHQRLRPHRSQLLPGGQAAGRRHRLRGGERPRLGRRRWPTCSSTTR